jgi:hypothetical protein
MVLWVGTPEKDHAMNANYLLLGSLVWYFVLAVAFSWEMNLGKALYFLGAFILTIGVYVME